MTAPKIIQAYLEEIWANALINVGTLQQNGAFPRISSSNSFNEHSSRPGSAENPARVLAEGSRINKSLTFRREVRSRIFSLWYLSKSIELLATLFRFAMAKSEILLVASWPEGHAFKVTNATPSHENGEFPYAVLVSNSSFCSSILGKNVKATL